MIFDRFQQFSAEFEAFTSQEIHSMPFTVAAIVEMNPQDTGLRTWVNLKPSEIEKLQPV